MGCDIHCVTEVRKDGKWQMATPLKEHVYEGEVEYRSPGNPLLDNRDYSLFAILNNVRGTVPKPLATPGLPDDISWYETEMCLLGDHSFAHVTLAQILAYDWTQMQDYGGWVEPREFARFKVDGRPTSYSGGVGGGLVKHVENAEMEESIRLAMTTLAVANGKKDTPEWHLHHAIYKHASEGLEEMITTQANGKHLYTHVTWQQPYYEGATELWAKAVPEMLALGKPEDVRLVFGFDS